MTAPTSKRRVYRSRTFSSGVVDEETSIPGNTDVVIQDAASYDSDQQRLARAAELIERARRALDTFGRSSGITAPVLDDMDAWLAEGKEIDDGE